MHLSARNRVSTIAAAALSLAFVTFLVVGSSRAAFSGTTDNTANSVTAAGVALADDDTGSAMFNVTGMKPGDTQTKCIVVTYNGTITTGAPIQLYRSGVPTGTGLETYLDATVEIGTGGSFSSCTGFTPSSTIVTGTLADFLTTKTSYATAQSTGWTPTGSGQSRTFRVTLTMQDDNAAQAKSVNFGFTWEARS
ncbi:MAG: hypothetical protein R2698_13930 [Microthrixaceae bacterium]